MARTADCKSFFLNLHMARTADRKFFCTFTHARTVDSKVVVVFFCVCAFLHVLKLRIVSHFAHLHMLELPIVSLFTNSHMARSVDSKSVLYTDENSRN